MSWRSWAIAVTAINGPLCWQVGIAPFARWRFKFLRAGRTAVAPDNPGKLLRRGSTHVALGPLFFNGPHTMIDPGLEIIDQMK